MTASEASPYNPSSRVSFLFKALIVAGTILSECRLLIQMPNAQESGTLTYAEYYLF